MDDGVAGNAERQCSVVHPVQSLGKAIAIDAPVVKGVHALGRLKHAHVMHPRRD